MRFLVALALPATTAFAQESKDAKKDGPQLLSVAPLAVTPGGKVTLNVRGLGLDAATEVKFPGAAAASKATIKAKGKDAVPQGFEAKTFGDTKAEVELDVSADAPPGELSVAFVTPAGETPPKVVRIVAKDAVTDEKEPNNGFREAQPVEAGKVVRGAAGGNHDVDVFRVDAKAGQVLVATVTAASAGSPLDPLLTVYDARGTILAQADDTAADARDPSPLRVTLPADGTYYVALNDAGDKGSPVHAYLLDVRVEDAGQGGTGTTPREERTTRAEK